MSEYMLLMSIIVLVATITSVVFVLQVQRRCATTFSAHLMEWENVQKRSQQIWEIQQEKRGIELDHSLSTHVQRVVSEWKIWEANDTARIAQQSNATLLHTKLEQEVVRLPYTDEVPLKELD